MTRDFRITDFNDYTDFTDIRCWVFSFWLRSMTEKLQFLQKIAVFCSDYFCILVILIHIFAFNLLFYLMLYYFCSICSKKSVFLFSKNWVLNYIYNFWEILKQVQNDVKFFLDSTLCSEWQKIESLSVVQTAPSMEHRIQN